MASIPGWLCNRIVVKQLLLVLPQKIVQRLSRLETFLDCFRLAFEMLLSEVLGVFQQSQAEAELNVQAWHHPPIQWNAFDEE
mmetsp:Transcript_2687/g.6205  ORF Transcript_2687/g.6205 Transcript_2687/m.6205 type:complete len:82 (-) Transcript_2687:52-297(-)|eukprot:CAMPEP_0173196762 /NCGR_PEP_ID=MMETSP1141-20130122/15796_1 /TAXON_ID=483371 /ORGANISM="non described non described, Strain CCMP2298" /LENGTH=81 /DNA_ID=CAMNT_0014121449 /DNA_START=898 /DNA_END=1143 /DNA_ORIENTATION=-